MGFSASLRKYLHLILNGRKLKDKQPLTMTSYRLVTRKTWGTLLLKVFLLRGDTSEMTLSTGGSPPQHLQPLVLNCSPPMAVELPWVTLTIVGRSSAPGTGGGQLSGGPLSSPGLSCCLSLKTGLHPQNAAHFIAALLSSPIGFWGAKNHSRAFRSLGMTLRQGKEIILDHKL